MIFSVGKNTMLNFSDVKIGMTPGRFDAKQVVLTALAIMNYSAQGKHTTILRTIDKTELANCSFFITDGFSSMFPNIPVYDNVSKVWDKYGEAICRSINSTENTSLSAKYAKAKVCALEKFDILLEYNVALLSVENEDIKFREAVQMAVQLIIEIIKSCSMHARATMTAMKYIEDCVEDVLFIPLNMNVREIVAENAKHIDWIITKEGEDLYRLEATNEDVDIRGLVLDKSEVVYAGRFFCKTTSYEAAKKIIGKI